MRRELVIFIVGMLVGYFGSWLKAGAATIECAAQHDRTAGPTWRYRLIDGRACWYRNDVALPKSELQWGAIEPARAVDEPIADEPITPVFVQTVAYKARWPPVDPPSHGAVYLVVVLGFVGAIAGILWQVRRRA